MLEGSKPPIFLGGIGEYVTEESGFKIKPIPREYLIHQLTNKIEIIVENEQLPEIMSAKAIERAIEFQWGHKAQLSEL